MRGNPVTNLVRIFAGASALLFTILAIPTSAQVAPESHAGRGFGPAYDAAHETILVGTIQEVVNEHVAGTPAGMHLLVAGLKGVVDAHVGSFLTEQKKDALHAGAQVLIVGVAVQLQDKEYFLARELRVGGRTVTIRNSRGCLVYPHADRIVKTDATAKIEGDEGSR